MASRVDVLQTQGINDVYEYNEIHLDSRQADNRGEPDGQTHPRFAITPPIPFAIGVKVLSAQIPFSWDIVTPTNNSFSVDGVSYSLPTGTYTLTSLLDTFNNLVAASSPTVVLGYNERTGALTIQDTALTSASIPGTLEIPPTGPVNMFGLSEPSVIAITKDATDLPGQVNVTGSNYALLTSAALAGRLSKNIRINGETTPHPVVLAKIPVTVNPGTVVLYNDSSPGYCFDMSMETLQNIDLMLLNGDDFTPLNIKSPWAVSLMVLSQRETSVPRIRDTPTRNGTAKRLRVE